MALRGYLLLLSLLLVGSVYGAVYVSDAGSDENDGTETTPYKTIKHAMTQEGGNDIILLGDSLSPEDNSNLEATGTVAISGSSTTSKISMDLDHNYFITTTYPSLTLANIDFTDGSQVVIANTDVDFELTLNNCNFDTNVVAKGKGTSGSVSVTSMGAASVAIDGCSFSGNSLAAGNGGALYIRASNESIVSIIGSSFVDNSVSGNGGAVYISVPKKSSVDIECNFQTQVFKQNVAGGSTGSSSMGGAFYVEGTGDDLEEEAAFVMMTLKGCTLEGNTATVAGGALALFGVSIEMESTNCINNAVLSEERDGKGGAVYVTDGSFNTNSEAFFIRNTAPNGGGLYMEDGWGGLAKEAFFDDNIGTLTAMQVYVETEDALTFDGCDFSCQQEYCSSTVNGIVIGNSSLVNLNNLYHDPETDTTFLDSLELHQASIVLFEEYAVASSSTPLLEIYRLMMDENSNLAPNAPVTISANGSFVMTGGRMEIITDDSYDLTIMDGASLRVEASDQVAEFPHYNIIFQANSVGNFASDFRVEGNNMVAKEKSYLTFHHSTVLHSKAFHVSGTVEVPSWSAEKVEPRMICNVSLLSEGSFIIDYTSENDNSGIFANQMCFSGGEVMMNAGKDTLEKDAKYALIYFDENICDDTPETTKLSGDSGYSTSDVSFYVNSTELYMKTGTGGGGGLGAGVVVGIIVGIVIVLGLFAAAGFFYVRHKRNSYDELAGGTERGSTFDYQG